MDYIAFRDAAFAYALECGCFAAETYYIEGKNFSAMVREGDIDTYSVSREKGLNLRVQLDGKEGYAYTESLEDPQSLVRHAMDNARSIDSDDEHPMQGSCAYPAIERPALAAERMGEREKIDLALKLDARARSLDPRVVRTMRCMIGDGAQTLCISNTLGLDASGDEAFAFLFVSAVAESEGEVKDGLGLRMGDGILDIDGCAAKAVEQATGRLGAKPVPAGTYRIIIENRTMAELLEAFAPMFSAEAAQKGLSLLANKEGTRVASDAVSIVDDPFLKENPRAFDAEGVPSVKTELVENGVLKTLLHNLKTAAKAGVASTSNAGRSSASSPISVAPSNLYIRPGEKSFDELVIELGDGLIIDDLSGMHAGLNTVSGEFSLLANGKLVKNGRVERAVEYITVAGSFLALMGNVEAVGADSAFAMPSSSLTASPSLLISAAVISGK